MHDLDAGIANQDVDASEARDDGGDALGDRFLVGDVHGDTDCLAATHPDFVGGRLGRGFVEVGDCHLRAFARVNQRDVLADAAGGTGDDGGFVLELHLGPLSAATVQIARSNTRAPFTLSAIAKHRHRGSLSPAARRRTAFP